MVATVHRINIDYVIESTSSSTTTTIIQTSIAISTVCTHNLSSFLYKYAPSQSFSPIDIRFPLFSVGLDFGLCSHTRRCRLSFSIALAAPFPCRRPCVSFILILCTRSRPPTALAATCQTHIHVRTPSTLLSHPQGPNPRVKQHRGLPPPSGPIFSRSLCSSFWRTDHGKSTNA